MGYYYVFDFVGVDIEVGDQDQVFFVIDDVYEVVFVDYCDVVGFQLVFGIENFFGGFGMLLVFFYYLWIFYIEFVMFVDRQFVVLFVDYFECCVYDWYFYCIQVCLFVVGVGGYYW